MSHLLSDRKRSVQGTGAGQALLSPKEQYTRSCSTLITFNNCEEVFFSLPILSHTILLPFCMHFTCQLLEKKIYCVRPLILKLMLVQCCTIPNIVKCLFDEINILNSSSIYSPWYMLFPSGNAAAPWACCSTCGRSPVKPICFKAGLSCSSSFKLFKKVTVLGGKISSQNSIERILISSPPSKKTLKRKIANFLVHFFYSRF